LDNSASTVSKPKAAPKERVKPSAGNIPNSTTASASTRHRDVKVFIDVTNTSSSTAV
jgi:hypothetical protein